MSKRVANQKGKPRKRVGRWLGHCKVPKWVKRKPIKFDPIESLIQKTNELM